MSLSSLDTNVVLRLILNDVPEQAARAASFIGRSSCYVTDVVVAECVFVLEKTYKLDRSFIKNSITTFFEINTVNFRETLVTEALDLYASQRTLSFADCYSIAEATLKGDELITFDRAILKKYGRAAKEPV